jgi:ubiquinone/menaquinone biosynthesis C-methylase UbiE
MRRQVLPYVSRYVRDYHAENGGNDGAGLNVLDVASGTGRFLTFLRDNWPAANYTALELRAALPGGHARFENKRFENVER